MTRTRLLIAAAAGSLLAVAPLAAASATGPASVAPDKGEQGVCVGLTIQPHVGVCVPAQVVPDPGPSR